MSVLYYQPRIGYNDLLLPFVYDLLTSFVVVENNSVRMLRNHQIRVNRRVVGVLFPTCFVWFQNNILFRTFMRINYNIILFYW